MKNYLFAPFRDDDDWAETWNSCKSGIDQGIMIFLGRVESTHDVIISELKAENRELKADAIHDANVSYELDDKHIDIIKRLETENKSLKEEVESLQDQLKECVEDYVK